MKHKTIFEYDETVLNTPDAVTWSPVQIGKTWTRMAVTDDGTSLSKYLTAMDGKSLKLALLKLPSAWAISWKKWALAAPVTSAGVKGSARSRRPL